MSEKKEKAKWSKKKKAGIIILCICIFLIIAVLAGGLIALNWYCRVADYEVVSASDIVKDDTKIIAHRGFRAVAPENTLPAFEKAAENGFWGAECDVYRTSDGIWVVQHDVNTYRMMDFTKSIEKCTLEELKSHKTDNGVNINDYPDLSICTLDEFMKVCDDAGMTAVIEIKGENNTEHYDEIIATVSNYDCDVVYISFHAENLEKMRKLTDDPMFLLSSKVTDEDIETAKAIGNCGIDFDGNKEKNYDNDSAIIKKCMDEGLEVGAWTIDNKDVMKKLLDLGVNYITTDSITY